MSRFTLSVLAIATCLATSAAYGVPPPGVMPPPAPPVADPAAPSVAEGKVQRLLMNPYGEVDGLRLADGTLVRFPPHLSESLVAAVKPGDTVRVIGRGQAPRGVRADAIVNTSTGQTVYDQPPVPGAGRPLPPHLRAQALHNGVILADGSIVRFPPDSLRVSVQPGAPFAAEGLGTRNTLGTSLEAMSLGTSLSALQPLYDRAR
ncbi:hypothetical protein D3C86_351380 [compost metagenome]